MKLPFLCVSVLLLAGCADPAPATVQQTEPFAAYGSIQGRVMDDEASPLANVTVGITETADQTLTADDGGFRFPDVPVGTYSLFATHPLYEDGVLEAEVLVDGTIELEFTLVKKPEFRPRNTTIMLEGRFDCGAEAPIITGPCWTLVEGLTCGEPIHYCVADPVFASQYEFRFMVEPRWETIVSELVWQVGANSLDGMRMYVENTNLSQQGGHGTAVSKVHGNQQPLTTRINRGEPAAGHELYADGKTPAFVPDEGGLQQIRVFPKGKAYQYTSQICSEGRGCLLGVGVGASVRFTVYLSIFYNEAAPSGFSAVPKA